ncbi:helix-turn-helix transcriptional regulator [Nitrosomonas sp. Is35]|uniref:helix-turn-helix domain-containing protein n=1 Tax=Nitrosomonas sp. Is35 TaxID=3080534 RepID=UPI00294B9016|nr:helix-turn-helix transcriptional regulator [Nitrosomonas sp. Is35]MDV6347097.1 helix-turn-helix transcriptional regulator [Nitrosomonas sp. Is35]
MSALINYQTILDSTGKPAFVVVPYAEFVKLPGVVRPGMIPNEVVGKRIMNEVSMLAAWREYLMLTQEEMAKRMGITQAGYAQIEAAKRPRKATLEKAAAAMGITLDQLAY